MALIALIGTKLFDVSALTLKFNNSSSGSDSGKYVVRVKAPDGQYYYFNGNTALTFASPNTATTPDFTTTGGNATMSAPLDTYGNIQNGTYLIDMNVWDITSSSLVQMTQQVVSFFFKKPTFALTGIIDCANATLSLKDETDYTFAPSFIVGSLYTLGLSKNLLTGTNPDGIIVTLPSTYNQTLTLSDTGVSAITTIQEEVAITNPLYAGLYTLSLIGTLLWTQGNGTSAYNISLTINESIDYTAACVGGICSVKCGIESLNAKYISAISNGDTGTANYALNQLTEISIQLTILNLAAQCMDTDIVNACLAQIQKIGNFNSTCCNSDIINYLIQPYFICACETINNTFVYRIVPATAASTVDSSGNPYNLGDQAYDANYFYLYRNTGVWKRNAQDTW